MIQIKDLTKNFGALKVLDNLNLELKDSGIVAILGPNGSGKTTLIKCILGMVIPNKGQIFWDGEKILAKSDYRKNLSYLPQIANFPSNISVSELIAMIKDLRGVKGDEQTLIDKFGLSEHLKKKLGNLSGGTKQKVNLLLTFMFDVPLFVLDEPTTGLDPSALIQLKHMVKEARDKGKMILLTSHIMSFVEEVADELVFILDGKIHYQGDLKQLKNQTDSADLESAIAQLVTA